MVYGMAWWTRHNICYGLAGTAWYMVWPCEVCHGMWIGIVLHALRIAMGYSPVHTWSGRCRRSSSYVLDKFTSRGPFTCVFRSHIQLLFTLGRDSKSRDCEFIDHCSGIDISTFTVIVCLA